MSVSDNLNIADGIEPNEAPLTTAPHPATFDVAHDAVATSPNERENSLLTQSHQTGQLRGIHEHHRHMLEVESRIDPDVITERGYYTATKVKELHELGFGASQSRPDMLPVLVQPIWNMQGQPVQYQIRPDNPRQFTRNNRRRILKYEYPKGAPLMLVNHPRNQSVLGNPAQALALTEGIKKQDALISRGMPTIGLLGVTAFRGTNANGGRVTLDDFDDIALNGRTIYLIFDSDWRTNSNVYRALNRLRHALQSRGANVIIINLPSAEDGSKQGADDFLRFHTLDELLACTISPVEIPHEEPRYVRSNNGLYVRRDKGTLGRLTNFDAEITQEICFRDAKGEIVQRNVRGVARFDEEIFDFECPTLEFDTLRPVRAVLPASAVIYSTRPQDTANAIRQLSNPVVAQTYSHIGWTPLEEGTAFFHAGGVIGNQETFEPRFNEEIGRFALPQPPEGQSLLDAIAAEFRWLETAEYRVTIPLLAAVFRAPLGPMDSSLILSGITGTGKSEQGALAMAHFGSQWDARSLVSWESTANYIQEFLASVSGVVVVLDELVTRGTPSEIATQNAKYDRILRGQGNGHGRGRMRQDRTLDQARPSSALIIATGEEIPRGHSLRARLVAVDVRRGDVRFRQLRPSQNDARNGIFASTMSAFIAWLAPQLDQKRAELQSKIEEYQSSTNMDNVHPRMVTNYANLIFGWELFLEFAESAGYLNDHQKATWWVNAEAVLTQVIGEQNELITEENPVEIFLDLLRSAISSGRAHIAAPGGTPPSGDEHVWGWQTSYSQTNPGSSPRGRCIGYLINDELLLDPSTAHRIAQETLSDGSLANLGVIKKRLFEGGLLLRREGGRNTYHVRVRRKDVVLENALVLSPSIFTGGMMQEEEPSHTPPCGNSES